MSETIVQKCLSKGVKLTDQRKIIVKVISESKEAYGESDHPDVDELYNRVSKIDSKISIATVYRTVKLFEESGILTKHEFKGGKARYEELNEGHHDHLIDNSRHFHKCKFFQNQSFLPSQIFYWSHIRSFDIQMF